MEKKEKVNCWEFKKCRREPGGAHIRDLGICPATKEERLNGVHGGKNGGRSCWVLAGTLCKGKMQGTFAQKDRNCDFYKSVKAEEFPKLMLSALLLKKLDSNRP